MENTQATRQALAEKVVDNMTMEDLITFVYHFLTEHYRASPDSFAEEWSQVMTEEKEG